MTLTSGELTPSLEVNLSDLLPPRRAPVVWAPSPMAEPRRAPSSTTIALLPLTLTKNVSNNNGGRGATDGMELGPPTSRRLPPACPCKMLLPGLFHLLAESGGPVGIYAISVVLYWRGRWLVTW